MSEFYFCWGPGPVQPRSFGHSQPPSSSTLLTQPGRAQNSVVPAALVGHLTDQQEREPGSFSLLQTNAQKEKKGKEKVPTGRVCCFHRAGGSRARLDYNPCYVSISALFTRCWALLSAAARFIITSPGKLCHLVKQTHENDAAVTAFQC